MILDESARQQLIAALGNRPEALTPTEPTRARPSSTEEAAAVVAWAARNGQRVYTISSGRAATVTDGLVLDLSGLNAIVEVNRDDMLAVAQAGVRVRDLSAAAAAVGLDYPPGFLAGPDETVGGALARGAGARSRLTGPHRDYALGLRVVFGTGEASSVGSRAIKNQTGYSLTQHVIGSWGALAVIAEATLRLTPARPAQGTLVLTYESTRSAAEAAVALASSSASPDLVEMVDRATAEAGDGSLARLLGSGSAWLLVRLEGLRASGVSERAGDVTAQARSAGATSARARDDDADDIWDAYRIALASDWAGAATARLRVGMPLSAVAATIDSVASLAARHKADACWSGGIGFGAGTLVLRSPSQPQGVLQIAREAVTLIRSAGGSVGVCSGLGLDYDAWLDLQLPPANAELMRLAKSALDPRGTLRPLLG